MRVLKFILSASLLTAILFTGGIPDKTTAQAQAASTVTDTMPARDAATSADDIKLTNNCIEGGKEKIYCLCLTKIFKYEMTLRQYRGAATLYNTPKAQTHLTELGYSEDDIRNVTDLSQELSSEKMFRTRCEMAETFFAALTQS